MRQPTRGRLWNLFRSWLAVVAAALLAGCLSARAEETGSTTAPCGLSIERIDVGIGGRYKVGRWTPLAVRVQSDRPCRVEWSVEVPDPYGNPTRMPGPTVEFTEAGEQTLSTLFRTGRLEGNLRLRLSNSDGHVEKLLRSGSGPGELPPALEQSVVLVATLGDPGGLDQLPELNRPVQVAALADVSKFPADLAALDGLDFLIVNGNPPFTARQSVTLHDWVRGGGRLTLAAGREAAAFQESRLYQWLREFVPLNGTQELRELSGLETVAEQSVPITVSRRRPVQAARIATGGGDDFGGNGDETADSAPFAGKILVKNELREPLVVRAACGFGLITFFGIDLDRPPISDWQALPEVLGKLVFFEYPAATGEERKRGRRLSRTGISDMSTQLLAALEDFPDLRRISTWTVLSLLLVYLAIIGPVDYFLVHRLFRNPWLTWFSFPLMVSLAAALAIWTARAANSRDEQLNQVDLVDVDASVAGNQYLRTQSWMTVYSPRTQRNRAEVGAGSLGTGVPRAGKPTAFRVSWAAAPEAGFGGMYRSGGAVFGRPGYHYLDEAAGIADLPLVMWSTASLTASRVGHAENLVESDLTSRGYGVLTGSFTHHFAGRLRDWMVAYGPSVYYSEVDRQTGDTHAIDPGLEWLLPGANSRQQVLEGYLTQTRLQEVEKSSNSTGRAEYRLSQSEYDPLGREPADILRMITFYRRVGGEKYTTLDNNSLRRLDCSPLLEFNRAILFARLEQPAADLEWNGKALDSSTRSTFVRVVLPVHSAK